MAGKKKSTGVKSRPSSSFTTSSRKLTCPTCGYVTFLKARYTKHVKYHSMPFIKCEFCEFESQYSWNLERHMKNHNNSDEKKMQCPLCNFACDMKQSLTSHVQNHHKDVPEEIMSQFRTSCASSPKKSSNPGSRRQSLEHFIQDHDLDNSYGNDEDETFGDQVMQMQVLVTQRQPLAHQPQHSQKKAKLMNEVKEDDRSLFMKKFYKCKFCNFNALSELGLSRHMSHSHKNKNNIKSTMGGGLGFGKQSANTKIHSQMPTLHKKSPGTNASTDRIRIGNNNVMKRLAMAKPMPNLIPIPKSSSLTSSPIMQDKSHSSRSNNTSHQSHEKPVPSSCQHQNQSHHQNKSEVEEDIVSRKVQFLQNLGLTPKSTKTASPTENLLSSYCKSHNIISQSYTSRKVGTQRRTSFFEKLSKKLTSNHNNKEEDTTTLSQSQASLRTDSIMKKTPVTMIMNKNNVKNSIISITSNSTRCQYCRHRNKTSQDLLIHLEQCQEAQRYPADEDEQEQEDSQKMDFIEGERQQIFVWNNGGVGGSDTEGQVEDEEDADEEEINQENENSDFHNFEGFSSLALDLENYERQMSSPITVNRGGISDIVSSKSNENSVTKSRKVYKCPQSDCEFWATTASRFHVHIVAHYNTKPFECSQCSYRSNWRWDITKHIKLKTMRDPGHTKAKVLLTHRSGERNYRKYDRYLVPMSVTYSADAKLPDCSTVASKRSDVELDSSPSPSASQKPKSSSNTNSKATVSSRPPSPSVFIPIMPKLTKAPPHSLVDGSYQNLRQALNSQSVKDKDVCATPTLPTLKPIITISPCVPLSNSKSSGSSAGRTFVEKKMLAGGEILQNLECLGREITVTPISSSSASNSQQVPGQNKSNTVIWKCKNCSFKNSNKNKVIVHINQNHKPKSGESMSILSHNNLVELEQQASGFLSTTSRARPTSNFSRHSQQSMEDSYNGENFSFSTLPESEMNENEENWVESEGEVYTCMYCSEEFNSQREGLEHILLHEEAMDSMTGLKEDAEGLDSIIGETYQSEAILPEEICIKPPRGSAAQQSGLIFKKYHCKECPYVTDSKGQFIYHKKFHIPSPNSPYKCGICSYRVSHKHLLQQHVRVHSSQEGRPENVSPQSGQLNLEQYDDENQEQDEVFRLRPRLMLWKDGQPYSVVRCCFCPQVFVNGRDLIEHEDQHKRNENNASSQSRMQYQIHDDGLDEDEEISYNDTDDKVLNLSTKSGSSVGSSSTGILHSQLALATQSGQGKSLLYLCQQCPARFFYDKELRIHSTFHERKNEFKCQLCSYSARQATPHLMSHMNVHSTEYQDKTRSLLQTKYRVAPKFDSQQPPALESQRMPILKRMTPVSISPSTARLKMSSISDASIPCRRCPARFSSLASFITHSQRHGIKTGFKCKHCDFGAQTQNNLTLHSILHAGSEVTIEPEVSDGDFALADLVNGKLRKASSELLQIPTVVPGAGVEEQDQRGPEDYMDFSVAGAGAFQGNPEFKYQTYVKNGKIKSKRYKCCKCPSAFEKRDQYKVHMGLHGSDQRYKCTVCDYSVTYYANFIQHLKKHENQANVTKEQLIATPISRMSKVVATAYSSATRTQQQTGGRNQSKSQGLDVTVEKKKDKVVPPLVLKVPKTGGASNKIFACTKCPFKSDNVSELSLHDKGHGATSHQEKCPFCSFSSNDKESLKGHLRVHFDTDFTPAMGVMWHAPNENGITSPTDSSDSEVENDDYEAVVKKANKKKIMVSFKPEICVEYC